MNKGINTPTYYFNTDEFQRQITKVRGMLGNVPLTYSIKANSFLLAALPDSIDHVEVCSPGELQICKKYNIPGSRIIYSGVNKELSDVMDALSYGVDIATVESLKHVKLEQEVADKLGVKQKVLLRLSSGNQFGMSEEDICIALSEKYSNLEFVGLHYYSGTQKKTRQINKDLIRLESFLNVLKEKYAFNPKLIEYGPGLAVDYFGESQIEEKLNEVFQLLQNFSEKYPLGIEMGRFLAATCGNYVTSVKDVKRNDGVNYVICDGGIHHLKYYGQMMAMQVPEIEVVNPRSSKTCKYCLCGSLCTVADVLVREVELPELNEESYLIFKKCGAYSVTEGSGLFLSRGLPQVYLTDDDGNLKKMRGIFDTYILNC